MLAILELNSGGREEAGRGGARLSALQVVGWVDVVVVAVGVAVVAVAGQVFGVDQGTPVAVVAVVGQVVCAGQGTPIAVVAVVGQRRWGGNGSEGQDDCSSLGNLKVWYRTG